MNSDKEIIDFTYEDSFGSYYDTHYTLNSINKKLLERNNSEVNCCFCCKECCLLFVIYFWHPRFFDLD